ncbi:MAG TPA: hypothetical protein VJ326_02715 [Thermoplasmata archaeon]|nr:hypothetical protein [Thermoplasmata archaeon]
MCPRLSKPIIASDGFIQPRARGCGIVMGSIPFVLSAVLMAVVSAAPDRASKPSDASMALRPSRPEPRELVVFLQMNPEEKFDIEAINSIDPQALIEETRGDRRVLREVVRTAEALLPRVRAETEDPLLVSAILRAKTLDWHGRSPSDPSWAASMPLRWGGIFFESRVPGGRLSRKLSVRLTTLINQCVEASGAVAFFRAGVSGIFRGSAMMAKMVQFSLGSKRPRLTQQVAQAYLDDLAATARTNDAPLPLERLSDLARRNGSSEVSMTLAELFPHDVANILTVLDPRFHPGMSALAIRVVPPRNPDDAATYDLVQEGRGPARQSNAPETSPAEAISGSPWDRTEMTKRDWLVLLKSLEKRKTRLEAPPRENPRDRESYLGLRELILTDSSGRKAFLAVHWKGRPSGLPLLCRLLSDRRLLPEADTDGDYLEAELDHPDKGHPDRRAKDGHWNLGHGWTVVRELADGGVRTYRADSKSAD